MSGGALLMWVLALGMFVYAAWRVVTALLPGGTDAKAWVMRVGYIVSAVIYTTFGFTAIKLASSANANTDGNSKVSTMTGDLMAHTGRTSPHRARRCDRHRRRPLPPQEGLREGRVRRTRSLVDVAAAPSVG